MEMKLNRGIDVDLLSELLAKMSEYGGNKYTPVLVEVGCTNYRVRGVSVGEDAIIINAFYEVGGVKQPKESEPWEAAE